MCRYDVYLFQFVGLHDLLQPGPKTGFEFGRRMYQVVRASQMSENIENKLVF